MSAVLNMFGSMEMYSQFPSEPEKSPLSERLSVVGLVVLLHLAAFAGYLLQPEMPAVVVNEMSISFANVEMQRPEVVPPKPELKPELSDEVSEFINRKQIQNKVLKEIIEKLRNSSDPRVNSSNGKNQ